VTLLQVVSFQAAAGATQPLLKADGQNLSNIQETRGATGREPGNGCSSRVPADRTAERLLPSAQWLLRADMSVAPCCCARSPGLAGGPQARTSGFICYNPSLSQFHQTPAARGEAGDRQQPGESRQKAVEGATGYGSDGVVGRRGWFFGPCPWRAELWLLIVAAR